MRGGIALVAIVAVVFRGEHEDESVFLVIAAIFPVYSLFWVSFLLVLQTSVSFLHCTYCVGEMILLQLLVSRFHPRIGWTQVTGSDSVSLRGGRFIASLPDELVK